MDYSLCFPTYSAFPLLIEAKTTFFLMGNGITADRPYVFNVALKKMFFFPTATEFLFTVGNSLVVQTYGYFLLMSLDYKLV